MTSHLGTSVPWTLCGVLWGIVLLVIGFVLVLLVVIVACASAVRRRD
jgi:hypothetical protein